MMTWLPRQETDHSVMTHASLHKSPQAATDRGNLANFKELLVMACELPQEAVSLIGPTMLP